MVSIQNAQLTLATTGEDTKIDVSYTLIVSTLDRHMVGQGLKLQEYISVWGIDPPGGYTGTLLTSFPTISEIPGITPGVGSQTINRSRSMTVKRAKLQEDTGLGDNDEIRCKIRVVPMALPTERYAWTEQEVLLG